MLRKFWKRDDTSNLDPLIDAVLEEMHAVGPMSENYPALMMHLKQLHEMKSKDKTNPVSRDTIVTVLGNLLGIVTIVAYEQKHVMRSVAMGHLVRPK